MARKGNQQRNGVAVPKKKVSESGALPDDKGQGKANEVKVFPGDELLSGDQSKISSTGGGSINRTGGPSNIKQSSGKFHRKEKQGSIELQDSEELASSGNDSRDHGSPLTETFGEREENGTFPGSENGPKCKRSGLVYWLSGANLRNMTENVELSGSKMVRNLRALALPVFKAAGEWLERQRPMLVALKTKVYSARDLTRMKFEQTYPVVWKCLIHIRNILLLLSMVWLDLTIRGIDSFIHLGTTSFCSIIWCSILSVIAMVGIFKFLVALAIAAFMGVFVGLTLGLLVVAISGTIFLWFYGSFWTTLLIITIGGLAFMLNHERVTVMIFTAYSIYCTWSYVGALGFLLALNLSFISSEILIYFLKNHINQQRSSNASPEQSTGMEDEPGLSTGESFSDFGPGLSADRSPGVTSTSGSNSELTSEEEVIRLLNCTDHYAVLGLARYENVDISLLKREYRKKAMLVHPDKNMGNDKAAEAFKKLQNAYEALLDSQKRKSYNEELRREELLNYFRRFQNSPQKNGERGFFTSGFAHSESGGEDPFGDARRIACKKCSNFHLWVLTRKSKFQARWCQECKDFHQAKDGDGWVEQSSQPIFFGILQKVDAPSAFVCADSKIYDATEWYTCQGMRCPANTHKPSFHVNTNVTSKHNTTGKGSSSGQRNGRMPNIEETMKEEEFFEWLQNAVRSGAFNNFSGSTSAESPPARAGSGPKTSGSGSAGSGSASSSSNKRKKKGKKQW